LKWVPRSLDDAARIDGCNTFGVLWRVGVPLVRPGIVSAAMFLFIGAWNDYLSGSVMVTSTKLRNIQFSIYSYLGFFGREWGKLTASRGDGAHSDHHTVRNTGAASDFRLTNGSVK
jgi:ABC-type glycerol-3-phosphate transport system permease component